jgi:hypothetical protein
MKMNRMFRKGSAIATVICFVALLMVLLTTLINNMRRQQYAVLKGLPPLQAKLMALSGVQHMLLKARLCPTELYDAWALAQGRNPLFSFSATGGAQPESNPGPRFVTPGAVSGSGLARTVAIHANDDYTTDPANWFNNDVFAAKAWPKIGTTAVPNSQIYLWKFIADVTNKAAIQPALTVATGTTFQDPYSGYYEITSLEILGQEGRRAYATDTIRFEVTGRVFDDFGFHTTETVRSVVVIRRRN